MSASSKKKLRKEQEAAVLTEKQLKEQKEAKKLKIYSVIFVAIMLVVAVTAVTVMIVKGVQSSGIIQKNTVAATVNEHKIDALQLNYYYNDTITSTYNEWTSSYGDMAAAYVAMMGLDLTVALDEQYYEEGKTWADYFLDVALDRAKADYTMYDLAMAEGFTMSEEDQANLEANIASMEFYATLYYGYSDVESYLDAAYGAGASLETYTEYATTSAIASAYYNAYSDKLVYDDATIRAYEADIYDNYSSFTYDSYYLTYNNYLEGGVEDESGLVTYSDEEKDAARAACKADADILGAATNTEELDAAIAGLAINADSTGAASTKNKDLMYTSIASNVREWLSDDSRQDGDVEVLPSEVTTTNDDGTETTDLYGYYVVIYHSRNDNTRGMANVRHLLVQFEEDEEGNVSDEAKAAAKEEADGYLKTWQDGEASEDSFVALVMKHSDDSSASTGGLFEDINPASAYVANFRNWATDANRKVGDAEVIETEYGYHVMYYCGDSDMSYRDLLITEDMKEADIEKWYNTVMEESTLTVGNTKFVKKDIILGAA